MKKKTLEAKFKTISRTALQQINGGGSSSAAPKCMIAICDIDGDTCPSPCYCDTRGLCRNR